MNAMRRFGQLTLGIAATGTMLMTTGTATAKDLPEFSKVAEDYQKVVSTADGRGSVWTVYRNSEDQQLLAELPRSFDGQKVFIATSVAGGSYFTGWQWMDMYCYWTRVKDTLVLMEPELQYQAHGDEHIQRSVKRTYSDRMILSVPIVAMGPGGGPVFDLDALLVGQAGRFGLPLNGGLTTIEKCKAFPQNLEIAFEGPGGDGRLTKLHYSISGIPKSDYRPREADERIGYFLTVFKDFAKDTKDGKQFVRYVNRWNIKKRDDSLALSPPEKPIIFYIENTVPVKYRRYVRDGILEWNKAFEKIGIDQAIEVRQQDAKTGAYMDLDPEDVRYNFFRWITSESAFAMGPSRVNPETGEILDADIIFDDAMARFYELDYTRLIAELPTEDADEDTESWVRDHPNWDPTLDLIRTNNLDLTDQGIPNLSNAERNVLQGDEHEDAWANSSVGRVVQQSRRCNYGLGMAHQMNMARLAFSKQQLSAYSDDELIDGLPEKFIAQVIKEVVTHEVGHTLGLRHNFKASTWKTLDQLNEDVGQAQVGSVMDYNPLNIVIDDDTEQGDWLTPVIGPYDYWAIEYGYTSDNDALNTIASRGAEDGLMYATDEDASGPDPLVRRFDLGQDPMDYAQREIDHANQLRSELLDRAVADGAAWYPARSFYQQLLYQQAGAVRIVTRFIGGTYVNRAHKGDEGADAPLMPVESEKQREALAFVIENSFNDNAYDLNPELLQYLATDKFSHWGNSSGSPEFPVHRLIRGVQRSALLSILNPTTLRRVYDNEMLVLEGDDAFTLPELLNTVTESIWTEVLEKGNSKTVYTNQEPMVSSLRRSLQREYLASLIDLSELSGSNGPPRAMQSLSLEWMVRLHSRIEVILEHDRVSRMDDYSRAHLMECQHRLDNAINSVNTYRGN